MSSAGKLVKSHQEKGLINDRDKQSEEFIPPDGGWGWIVSVATGMHLLVMFGLSQHFGIVFRDYMRVLGISSSQMTTIINVHITVAAVSGLFNAPLFRNYTYRQVALIGSFLTFFGIFLSAFANTFLQYIVAYSCIYGFGRGFTLSACTLAINTYFKKQRRNAASYQCGVSGLGPIGLPYLATYLLDSYGVKWTVFLFAALALNGFVCSLTYRPIHPITAINKKKNPSNILNSNCQQSTDNKSTPEQDDNMEQSIKLVIDEQNKTPTKTSISQKSKSSIRGCCQGLVEYFDLELLKDPTYINLSFGLTLIYFAEFNFAILTPVILADFLFANEEIATAMSLCGLADLVVRFLMPILTSGSALSNQAFFIIGLMGMCLGRLLLSFVRNVYYMWAIFLGIGVSKAFRTVFWGLVLPSYLPLERLAAGTGLQLVMSALFTLGVGPLIGLIRDYSNYVVTLHIINGLTLLAISMWLFEIIVKK